MKAIYKYFNHDKANSECGTMRHEKKETKTTFGQIGLWYSKENNEWFEDNQDKVRWNIKKIIHKYFKTNFILIDIVYAEVKNPQSKSLSFFSIEYTVTHKENIMFDSITTSKHEQINKEIIQYIYTLPMGFTHKGDRKPRNKSSEDLNEKMTSDITLVENMS
jgi:hypothetical protein